MMVKKTVCILLIIFSLGILVYFSLKTSSNYKKRKGTWQILQKKIEQEVANFQGETGIFIEDFNTGWQILINPDKSFPSASLVKVPIMAACFYAVGEGKIKLEESLALRAKHKSLGSGILKDVPVGTKFTIAELIELMIFESDNTATNMLIERLGFDYLNNCFKRLGLEDTHIYRKMMDFRSRRAGKENYTTCRDLAFLLEEVYRHRLINKDISAKCLELLKRQKIKDRIPVRLPAQTMVAHKTGLEKGVCHDAGIVFTAKGNFLICVLTRHNHKTARPAKDFIAQIALLTYNYY